MTETEAARRLRIFLERIERLEEERKTIADDIAEVYKELSGDGFDKDAAKVVLKIRKNADALTVWQDRSEMVDLYLSALGIIVEKLPAPAPARVREIIEHFPHSSAPTSSPETTDSPAQPLTVPGAPFSRSATPAGSDGDPSTPSPEADGAKMDEGCTPNPDRAAQAVDITVNSGQAVTIPEPFEPPAFLKKDRPPLRPHCLHPENLELCAGSGSKHCYACTKAAGQSEAA